MADYFFLRGFKALFPCQTPEPDTSNVTLPDTVDRLHTHKTEVGYIIKTGDKSTLAVKTDLILVR